MNVKTRAEFEAFLDDLRTCEVVAWDTETNGLRHHRDNYIISLQAFFPEFDRSYMLAFRHGEGKIDVRYSKGSPKDMPYEEMKWGGNTKKDLFRAYWFDKFHEDKTAGTHPSITLNGATEDYFGNLPIQWLEEIKPLFARPAAYFHNAKFDLHMLTAEGFEVPERVYDTMIGLHIVYNDWNAGDFEAPYTYTQKEDKARAGQWARGDDGKLKTKKQNGNRQLKWQANRIGLAGAAEGEESLTAAVLAFEEELVGFAMSFPDDPMNAGLKTYKQFRTKIKLDTKANMWMLPSDAVAEYAENDTRLTWGLWLWCEKIIQQWNNLPLWESFNEAMRMAFLMEYNGFQLDKKAAIKQIKELKPQIEQLHWLVTKDEWKLGNSKKLLEFLNSGVLAQEFKIDLPEWFPDNKRANTKTYPNVKLKSTEAQELEKVEDHILVRIILEHRKLKKTRDTYLVNWVKASTADGIVRGGINESGTNTGRSSSGGEAGNLQNIPERKGYGIKRVIVPYGKGWSFFAIDYGQLEGRLAAWIAEQLLKEQGVHNLPATMLNLFNGDFDPSEYPTIDQSRIMKDGSVDLHKFTREILDVRGVLFPTQTEAEILTWFGYNPADKPEAEWAEMIDDEIRQMSKTTNFGLLYSGTRYMLSKQLRIELDAAEELVQRWRKIFPAFAVAQSYFTELALRRRPNPTGTSMGMYVTQPISGRHLKYQHHSDNRFDREDKRWYNLKETSAKKAWNGIVQGLGGWLTFDSLSRFGKKHGWEGIKPFAIIHDAIDGYYQTGYEWKVKALMDMMVDYETNPVLTVELKISTENWQDLKKVKDVKVWSNSQ
jgi:DNA polymerase I-like protein with 3'-5' exonuclease and polymerase domains